MVPKLWENSRHQTQIQRRFLKRIIKQEDCVSVWPGGGSWWKGEEEISLSAVIGREDRLVWVIVVPAWNIDMKELGQEERRDLRGLQAWGDSWWCCWWSPCCRRGRSHRPRRRRQDQAWDRRNFWRWSVIDCSGWRRQLLTAAGYHHKSLVSRLTSQRVLLRGKLGQVSDLHQFHCWLPLLTDKSQTSVYQRKCLYFFRGSWGSRRKRDWKISSLDKQNNNINRFEYPASKELENLLVWYQVEWCWEEGDWSAGRNVIIESGITDWCRRIQSARDASNIEMERKRYTVYVMYRMSPH